MTRGGSHDAPLLARPDPARPVPRPRWRRDRVLPVTLVLSVVAHVALVAPWFLGDRKHDAPPPTETPVEIIEEPKKEPEKDAGTKAAQAEAEQAKAKQAEAEKAKAAQAEAKKAEQVRAEQAEADKAKAEKAKAEAEKAEQAKVEQAKVEQAKVEQAKSRQAKAERAKAQEAKAEQAKAEQTKTEQAKARQAAADSQAEVAKRMQNLLGQRPESLDPTALPGEGADGTISATYQQLVMSRLTKALTMDRHPGKPGFATVAFAIGDHGDIASVELRKPSGDPVLDAEAIAVVKRAAPFPPPPPGGRRDYTVTLESKPVL